MADHQKPISTEILDMKLALGCETDAALAQALGKNPTTIAQWKRRNAIPERAKIRFHLRLRENAA